MKPILTKPNLSEMSVAKLRDFCRDHDIKGHYAHKRRDDLVSFIEGWVDTLLCPQLATEVLEVRHPGESIEQHLATEVLEVRHPGESIEEHLATEVLEVSSGDSIEQHQAEPAEVLELPHSGESIEQPLTTEVLEVRHPGESIEQPLLVTEVLEVPHTGESIEQPLLETEVLEVPLGADVIEQRQGLSAADDAIAALEVYPSQPMKAIEQRLEVPIANQEADSGEEIVAELLLPSRGEKGNSIERLVVEVTEPQSDRQSQPAPEMEMQAILHKDHLQPFPALGVVRLEAALSHSIPHCDSLMESIEHQLVYTGGDSIEHQLVYTGGDSIEHQPVYAGGDSIEHQLVYAGGDSIEHQLVYAGGDSIEQRQRKEADGVDEIDRYLMAFIGAWWVEASAPRLAAKLLLKSLDNVLSDPAVEHVVAMFKQQPVAKAVDHLMVVLLELLREYRNEPIDTVGMEIRKLIEPTKEETKSLCDRQSVEHLQLSNQQLSNQKKKGKSNDANAPDMALADFSASVSKPPSQLYPNNTPSSIPLLNLSNCGHVGDLSTELDKRTKPWVVVALLPKMENAVAFRHHKRSAAEGYAIALKRMQPQNDYIVVYDPPQTAL